MLRGLPSRSIALAATIKAWVESRPPETPMTSFRNARRSKALLKRRHLDVVGLVAILRQFFAIRRHEGKTLDVTLEADVARPAA